MARVVLERVSKHYPAGRGAVVRAVGELSLEVADGELVVLVGPSGCGKTTTLRMIAGLERVTEGTIRIGDRVVNEVEPEDRDVAMVFQGHALYPHLSVFENLAFGLRLRKEPKGEIVRRVEEAARILGIEGLLERDPAGLSGGERQRVAVGRAIVRRPRVFLLDEPLSGLDARLRVQLRGEVARLQRRLGVTMVYVTHDQAEAMALGDRLVVLDRGVVQQVGRPARVYGWPANQFVADFIGSPAMNLVRGGLVAGEAGGLEFREGGASRLRVPVPTAWVKTLGAFVGREVVLGIRPEAVRVLEGVGEESDARVEWVEDLGADTWLRVSTGRQELTVRRFGVGERWSPGMAVRLAFETEGLRFFDGGTGLALSGADDAG